MKRYFKRSVSLWAAFMMLFNVILPTGSFAELGENTGLGGTEVIAPPSKDYTVTSILGNGVYYGIVANVLDQQNHLQTNFAVNTYAGGESNVQPDLSGASAGVIRLIIKRFYILVRTFIRHIKEDIIMTRITN